MKLFRILAGVAVAGALLIPAAPASAATPDGAHPVTTTCAPLRAFYGNPDEKALVDNVKSGPFGFTFTGPSLVHHAMALTSLADTPKHAELSQSGTVGNPALFKLETTAPYSTVNLNTYGPNAGKWWSSKIPTGPGSQNDPVTGPADLAVLAPYTADTRVFSWGFGYANDTGNVTQIKSVTWMGVTTSLMCKLTASPLPPNPKPTKPAAKPGPKKSHTAAPELAKTPGPTDSKLVWIGGVGGVLVLGGAGLILATRSRAS
jgi:hypothetical protein